MRCFVNGRNVVLVAWVAWMCSCWMVAGTKERYGNGGERSSVAEPGHFIAPAPAATAPIYPTTDKAVVPTSKPEPRETINAEEDSCPICLDPLEPLEREAEEPTRHREKSTRQVPQEEKDTQLPCSHRFHGKCIHGWFHDHLTCPLCRSIARAPRSFREWLATYDPIIRQQKRLLEQLHRKRDDTSLSMLERIQLEVHIAALSLDVVRMSMEYIHTPGILFHLPTFLALEQLPLMISSRDFLYRSLVALRMDARSYVQAMEQWHHEALQLLHKANGIVERAAQQHQHYRQEHQRQQGVCMPLWNHLVCVERIPEAPTEEPTQTTQTQCLCFFPTLGVRIHLTFLYRCYRFRDSDRIANLRLVFQRIQRRFGELHFLVELEELLEGSRNAGEIDWGTGVPMTARGLQEHVALMRMRQISRQSAHQIV